MDGQNDGRKPRFKPRLTLRAKRRRGWPWLKIVTIATPLITLAVGAHQFIIKHDLETQIAEANQNFTRMSQTREMLKVIDGYIDKMEFNNDKKKSQIIVSMVKVMIDAQERDGGKLDSDHRMTLKKIPMYFALFADQHEMLADIGATPEDMAIWVGIAMNSGDPSTTATGLRALNLVLTTRRDEDTRVKTIQSLIELDKTIDRPDLLRQLLDIYRNFLCQLDLDNAGSTERARKAIADLVERVETRSPRLLGFQPTPDTGGSKPKQPDLAACQGQTPNKPFLMAQAPQPYITTDRQKLTNIINTVAPDARNDQPEPIATLIADLESTDSPTRQAARRKLGKIGQDAIPPLLDLFEQKPRVYRVRLGVVASLALMDPQIEMAEASRNRLSSLAEMLSESDPTIRGNAHELFAGLLNPTTIAAVQPAVLAAMEKRTDDYFVARIAAIVALWFDPARTQTLSPDLAKEIDVKLERIKETLKPEDRWNQARGNIDFARQRISDIVKAKH